MLEGNPGNPSRGNQQPDPLARPRNFQPTPTIGKGFTIDNDGRFVIVNPSNIRSFFDIHGQPNTSQANRV